jgi:small multidrug resistance family-3 protein
MRSSILFLMAGLLEIGGGYLVWIWLRGGRSPWLGLGGVIALALYGIVPVFQPSQHHFGRIYAAYGAVFIVLSLLWGWGVDGHRPDLRDGIGSALALAGALVMMGPRS